jgi:hypothetical protein
LKYHIIYAAQASQALTLLVGIVIVNMVIIMQLKIYFLCKNLWEGTLFQASNLCLQFFLKHGKSKNKQLLTLK